MIGLDTNVLVRYLTRDDLEQFDLVKQFIQQNCTWSSPGFINSILEFIESKQDKNWFILKFCSLSTIGNLHKMKDVESIANFFVSFYDAFPVDWLFQHYLHVKFCRPHQVNKIRCKDIMHEYVFHHKPSLFQHMGYFSSLNEKVSKLKDHSFSNY